MHTSTFFLPAKTPTDAASFLLCEKGSGKFVLTLNTELLARGICDPDFAALIQNAPYRVCDSVGAKLISGLFLPDAPIPRITGVDLGEGVLRLCALGGIPVFLLGGKQGVAKAARDSLCAKYPSLQVAGVAHGYFTRRDMPALRGMIGRSGAKVVIVCLGSPLQEQWIWENRDALPQVKLFLPLGGSMDVYANALPRAPLVCRQMGLEWLFRLLPAPDPCKRWRRLASSAWILLSRGREWKAFFEKMK